MVSGYESLIPAMTNHPGDRHIPAVAVKCGADSIVSDNTRHFPPESLAPYGLECFSADRFLAHLYHLDPAAFTGILLEQARDIERTLPQLLARHVPSLSKLIRE